MCWGKVLETLQEKAQPSDVPPRAEVQESNSALGCFINGTDLITALHCDEQQEKKPGVIYDYGKSY